MIEIKLECLKISADALAKTGQYSAKRAEDEAKGFFGWISEGAGAPKALEPSAKPKSKKSK